MSRTSTVRTLPARDVLIAPSILSADFARLGEQVREAEAHGADLIHIDVMDGRFVPNITIGPLVVRALRQVTDLPLQVHLMLEEPERHIEAFAEAGADMITVHVETCPHLDGTLSQIQATGVAPSVTLNPATPVSVLEHVLQRVSLVLVMSVNPGFGGQQLIPYTLDKVTALRREISERGLAVRIEVDGGVNQGTLPTVLAAGADVVVMGAAVFRGEGGIEAAMRALRETVDTQRSAVATPG